MGVYFRLLNPLIVMQVYFITLFEGPKNSSNINNRLSLTVNANPSVHRALLQHSSLYNSTTVSLKIKHRKTRFR